MKLEGLTGDGCWRWWRWKSSLGIVVPHDSLSSSLTLSANLVLFGCSIAGAPLSSGRAGHFGRMGLLKNFKLGENNEGGSYAEARRKSNAAFGETGHCLVTQC